MIKYVFVNRDNFNQKKTYKSEFTLFYFHWNINKLHQIYFNECIFGFSPENDKIMIKNKSDLIGLFIIILLFFITV